MGGGGAKPKENKHLNKSRDSLAKDSVTHHTRDLNDPSRISPFGGELKDLGGGGSSLGPLGLGVKNKVSKGGE